MSNNVIYIPKENVNDDQCRLIELFLEPESKVSENQLIAIFETSKSTFEIRSNMDGYIYFSLKEDELINIGDPFCIINVRNDFSDEEKNIFVIKDLDMPNDNDEDNLISNEAKELLNEHSININDIQKDGLIRKKDILDHLYNTQTKNNFDINNIKINNQRKNILVFGAGGHAKMMIDIINNSDEYNLVGLVDAGEIISKAPIDFDSLNNIPIIGSCKELNKIKDLGVEYAINAVGFIESPKERNDAYNYLIDKGFTMPNIIHRSATLEKSVKMGCGNHILASATIGSSATIGNNCIVNSGSVVSHDVILEDNVHVTPGALIAGYVKVGSNTIIGMGSTINVNINIGENVSIHNNSNIVSNIIDNKIIKNV